MPSPAELITRAIVFFVSVGVHEFGHAWVAYLMGDDTAKKQGRMTLNPIPNIWWPGFFIAILGGPAILGSAPVNKFRMRNPRWGNFAAVFAGPLFSFILAVIAAIPLRFGLVELPGPFEASQAIPTAQQVLWYMAFINIFLFLFNLLPLFPLDGWTVMAELLPRDPAGIWWQRNQTNSMYVLYGLIALSFIAPRLAEINPVLRFVDVIGQMILPPAFQLMDFLVGL